jgi:hypothetical protein
MHCRVTLIAFPVLILSGCAQHDQSLYKPFVKPVTCCISCGVPKPVIDSSMAGKQRLKVSDNITTIECFDSLGRVSTVTYVYPGDHSRSTTVYTFDNRNNIAEIRRRDTNGNPVQICICGYSIVRLKYDESNRLIEEAAYDDKDQPAIAEGTGCFHRAVYRYQGRRCIVEYFDDVGKMAETKTYRGDTISYYGKQ